MEWYKLKIIDSNLKNEKQLMHYLEKHVAYWKKKKKLKIFVFLYSRFWSLAVLLSDVFYLYMAHFASINIDFFFSSAIWSIQKWAFHLEEHEIVMRIIPADVAVWYQITSLSLAVLMLCADFDAFCI